MIGMQDKQKIERFSCYRIDLVRLRRYRKQHVQEILAIVEIVTRVNKWLATVQFVRSRRNRWQFRQNTVRKDIPVLFVRRVHLVVVIRGHGSNDS